jgi:excisionase family DNA binding protein
LQAPPNNYIRIAQAASAAGLSYRHVRRLIADGELRALEVDGLPGDGRVRWVVRITSLRAYQRRVAKARA